MSSNGLPFPFSFSWREPGWSVVTGALALAISSSVAATSGMSAGLRYWPRTNAGSGQNSRCSLSGSGSTEYSFRSS